MISARLREVILNELHLDDFPLAEATTANQVPGWDSLSHVKIICAVEKEFGIRFKSLEVVRLRNVGQLQELVDKKIGKSVA
jgi:acyl carrier protein